MNERRILILATGFLVCVAALGGASRADELTQLPLRLIAIAFLTAGLWAPNSIRMNQYRPLFGFVLAILTLQLLQLVPLPYGLWESLPGRSFYAQIADRIGLAHAPRPLSFVPEMTWNSLLSMLIPLTALVLAAQVPVAKAPRLLFVILGIVLVSLILGHAQAAGGSNSPFRYYSITNRDAMVGLFANRNHHALLLALALPMCAALLAARREDELSRRLAAPVIVVAGLIIISTLLFAGSRAGLITAALGLVAGGCLYSAMSPPRLGGAKAKPTAGWTTKLRHPWAAPIIALLLISAVAIAFASTPSMQRLLQTSAEEEERVQMLPSMVELGEAMLPLGGGFGSFDQLFRRFEQVDQLTTAYMNHAHMEPIQLFIEGGIPAILLLLAFFGWWAWKSWAAWRGPRSTRLEMNLARLGSITTGLAMAMSLSDYPLRTPLHASIFVIGCIWLQRAGQEIRAIGR